jgi:hypothetical protein
MDSAASSAQCPPRRCTTATSVTGSPERVMIPIYDPTSHPAANKGHARPFAGNMIPKASSTPPCRRLAAPPAPLRSQQRRGARHVRLRRQQLHSHNGGGRPNTKISVRSITAYSQEPRLRLPGLQLLGVEARPQRRRQAPISSITTTPRSPRRLPRQLGLRDPPDRLQPLLRRRQQLERGPQPAAGKSLHRHLLEGQGLHRQCP